MARLFGTDGIRGLANGDVLTPELAMRLFKFSISYITLLFGAMALDQLLPH